MTVTAHDCRLRKDPEYRRGYAYGIDHEFAYDVLSADELLRYAKVYKLIESSFADGLAQYCREIAQQKGAILNDPGTSTSHRCLVSRGLR
jgi:hypothetical protein